MREIEKIAESLFEKIRSRFEGVSIGDENAKQTQDPGKAKFFNFNYTSRDGTNFGNVTISLIDENSLKVYFSKNISDDLDDDHKTEWFEFLKGLRMFAKRNLLNFDTRDIAKGNLEVKDLKQQGKSDSVYTADEVTVNESKMYGTSRSSYDNVGETRLIVRHSANVDENKRGARTRNIDSIFIETGEGERFKLPTTNLHVARAIGQHVVQGGTMLDERAAHIFEMAREMSSMGTFVRAMHHRTFEDAESAGMVEAAAQRYKSIKNTFQKMRSGRGYSAFFDGWQPSEKVDTSEETISELRDRFTKKIFDDKLSEALPYVYSAYQNRNTTQLGKEFEAWANDIVEGTWSTPDTEEKLGDLIDLMAKPLEAGIDGDNATSALYDIIGDDQLFDLITQVARDDGVETDVRPLVMDWLNANMPDVAAQVTTDYQPNPEVEVPNQTTGPTTTDEFPTENADGLDFLRSLAGLK